MKYVQLSRNKPQVGIMTIYDPPRNAFHETMDPAATRFVRNAATMNRESAHMPNRIPLRRVVMRESAPPFSLPEISGKTVMIPMFNGGDKRGQ